MGEEMEGAVQQAAQPGLQFMRLPNQERDCLAAVRAQAHSRLKLSYREEETLF